MTATPRPLLAVTLLAGAIVTFTIAPSAFGAADSTLAAPRDLAAPVPGHVTMPVTRFEELLEAARAEPPADPDPPKPPPIDVASDLLDIEIDVKASHADVTLRLSVRVLADGWVSVPLLPDEAPLRRITMGGTAVAATSEDGHHVLHLQGRGSHSLSMSLRLPIESLVAGHRIRFPVPRAVAASLHAEIPGTGWDAHVLPAAALEVGTQDGKTVLDAALARTDAVQLLWGRSRPDTHALRRAAYTLEVVGEGVFATLTHEVEISTDSELFVPLLPGFYALRKVTVDGEPGAVATRGGHHFVRLRGDGVRHVAAEFALNVDRTGGQPAIELNVPPAPIARFTLTVPGEREIAIEPPVPLVADATESTTRVVAHVPETSVVRFAWTDSRPVPDQNIRMNAEGHHAITAEEGGLRVAARHAFDVISGKAREIGFVVPTDVVIYEVTGDGVADWRTFTADDATTGEGDEAAGALPGERRLQVYFDEPRHGEVVIEVAYDLLLDPRRAEASPVEIPLLEPSPVHRYQRVALFLAGEELELEPVRTEGFSRIGGDALPAVVRAALPAKVAHGFKSVGPPRPLTARLVEPRAEAPRFDATTTTLVTIDEGVLRGESVIDLGVKSGAVRELELVATAATNVLDVVAPSLLGFSTEPSRPGEQTLRLRFTEELTGQVRVGVRFERLLDPGSRNIALAPVVVSGAEVQRGHVAIESTSALEVETVSADGIRPIALDELPRSLRSATVHPILLAFTHSHAPWALELSVTRHERVATEAASVPSAEITTTLERQGNVATTARFRVENRSRQFLRVALPDGADVRRALVDGEAIRPGRDDSGRLIIPLPRSDDPFDVEITLAESRLPLGLAGTVTLNAPRPDVFVDSLQWTIDLPDEPAWRGVETNVGTPPDPVSGAPFTLTRALLAPDDPPPTMTARHVPRHSARAIDLAGALLGLLLGLLLLRATDAPRPVERAATLGLAVAAVLLVAWLGASPWAAFGPIVVLSALAYFRTSARRHRAATA